MRKLILLSLFLMSFSAIAQEQPEVMTAANIRQLQSVAQINFADIDAEFDTGWFVIDELAAHLAVYDTNNHIYVFAADGTLLESIADVPAETRIIDMVFAPSSAFPTFETEPALYTHDAIVTLFDNGLLSAWGIGFNHRVNYSLTSPNWTFINLWLGENQELYDAGNQSLWSELQFSNGEYRVQENYLFYPALPKDRGVTYPYAPAQDTEAVVRIGRIPPPYTVTSSLDGIVKLWNLQTGETLYEVDNGTGQPSVFGAINLPPTHLVWRDNANESLYLLNFETGENRLIDELNGDYAQWYFLSPDATVILGIDLGFNQSIVAWDVATGERIDLGLYRQCNRPQPDMVRLSADGTTLVIGCDTGLDIWRIVN